MGFPIICIIMVCVFVIYRVVLFALFDNNTGYSTMVMVRNNCKNQK